MSEHQSYSQLWSQLLLRGDRNTAAWLIIDLFEMHDQRRGFSGSTDLDRQFDTNDIQAIWMYHLLEILDDGDGVLFSQLRYFYLTNRERFLLQVRAYVDDVEV